jgi:hypothetical protein
MALYAIKVGTGDGAGQQIVEADSPGAALTALEAKWAAHDIRTPSRAITVAPASAVNFTPTPDA